MCGEVRGRTGLFTREDGINSVWKKLRSRRDICIQTSVNEHFLLTPNSVFELRNQLFLLWTSSCAKAKSPRRKGMNAPSTGHIAPKGASRVRRDFQHVKYGSLLLSLISGVIGRWPLALFACGAKRRQCPDVQVVIKG